MSKSMMAAVGAGVGVAAASVITLLVLEGDREPTNERDEPGVPLAASFTPPSKTLPEGTPRPYPAPADKPAVTAPTDAKAAADQAKADAAADQAKAEARAKADRAKAEADAKLARKQAIDEARKAGILGQTTNPGGAFASLTGTGDISSGFDDANIYGGLIGSGPATTGGYGGGGTGGFGTIGRGTGTGYGVGTGRGGMRGRTAAVPTVSLAQFTVTPIVASADEPGNLDKAIVRRYIKRNIQKIQYCYEKQLLAKADLKGTVTVSFAVTSTGVVGSSTASGVDGEVSSCISSVISGIEFPKPKGTGGVQVGTAFTFKPAGG